MNDNPWHVDDMARMQRERIQEEMRQIRMEDSVRPMHPPRVNWPARVVVQAFIWVRRWFVAEKRVGQIPAARPSAATHPRGHAHN